MPELSPAAQAIDEIIGDLCDLPVRCVVAAALCAVADQVVPDEGDRWTRDLRGDAFTRWEQRKATRRDLLVIAAELEGQALQPPTQPTIEPC